MSKFESRGDARGGIGCLARPTTFDSREKEKWDEIPKDKRDT